MSIVLNRHQLWKSVEIFFEPPSHGAAVRETDEEFDVASSRGRSQEVRACSACAGDYQDPDRTAWAAHEGEDETAADGDEFPAES